jgi:hypothetical protein
VTIISTCACCGGAIECHAYDIDPRSGVRGRWEHLDPVTFPHEPQLR